MSRQIITKERVLEILAEGQDQLRLEPHDIITAVAIEMAEQKGLRIIRSSEPDRSPQPAAASPGAAPTPDKTPPTPAPTPARTPPTATQEVPPTARQIKEAVLNQLGNEPDGLDAIISKVLKG